MMILTLFIVAFFKFSSLQACDTEDFNYAVNLMWVNKEKDETQAYIAPSQCFETAKKWHEAIGDNDAVNFWYDSQYVTENALRSTKEYLQGLSRLHLCDLRELNIIKTNKEVFQSPIPLFFRVDLLREIAVLNVAAQKEFKYIVYVDQDVPVMTKEYLFYKDKISNNPAYSDLFYDTSETLRSLKAFGLTCCAANDSSGNPLPENSFFILDRDNPHIQQARQIGLVDVNILRAKKALEKGGYGDGSTIKTAADKIFKDPFKEDKHYVDMQQIVWSSFPGMVKLYHLISGKGIITDENFRPDPNFNQDNYDWINLFDLESTRFNKYTQLDIVGYKFMDGGWKDYIETKQYAPNDATSLFGRIHKKCIGQPTSRFVQ